MAAAPRPARHGAGCVVAVSRRPRRRPARQVSWLELVLQRGRCGRSRSRSASASPRDRRRPWKYRRLDDTADFLREREQWDGRDGIPHVLGRHGARRAADAVAIAVVGVGDRGRSTGGWWAAPSARDRRAGRVVCQCCRPLRPASSSSPRRCGHGVQLVPRPSLGGDLVGGAVAEARAVEVSGCCPRRRRPMLAGGLPGRDRSVSRRAAARRVSNDAGTGSNGGSSGGVEVEPPRSEVDDRLGDRRRR